MKETFVTITGFKHYYGKSIFTVGSLIKCVKAIEIDTKCNYQDKAKTVLTAEQKLVRIEGTVLIPGDIAPEIFSISSGEVEVLGIKRNIYKGEKARNPDSTVNYTKLELN